MPQHRRIVVADDNEDSAQSFAMLLSFSGHEVRIAHDGEQALDTMRDFRPDVAFLDIGMPRLSGYEVAEAVRAEPWGRDMKLIAVTGWGQADDTQRARSVHLGIRGKILRIDGVLHESLGASHAELHVLPGALRVRVGRGRQAGADVAESGLVR